MQIHLQTETVLRQRKDGMICRLGRGFCFTTDGLQNVCRDPISDGFLKGFRSSVETDGKKGVRWRGNARRRECGGGERPEEGRKGGTGGSILLASARGPFSVRKLICCRNRRNARLVARCRRSQMLFSFVSAEDTQL